MSNSDKNHKKVKIIPKMILNSQSVDQNVLLEEKRIQSEDLDWDLKVQNLVKHYGKKVAVNDISFGLCPGNIMGFLGTNGAGKSTTFKVLAGEIYPTSGEVHIKNK